MDIGYASIAMSLIGGYASRATAKAQATVDKAQADAANTIRQGRNVQAASESSLARWMQSENNNRRLKAAGSQYNAGMQNLLRQRAADVSGSVESQLADSEAAGAYAANAAFSGTGGNAVDMIDLTMRLRNSRATALREKNQGYADYDALQQLIGIVPQTAAGLDTSTVLAGIDYSVNLAPMSKSSGNAVFDVLSSPGLGSVLQSFGTSTAARPTTGDFARLDRANYNRQSAYTIP